ncbi:hypothetical protein ACLOJK_032714 [Asimina triloba]
MSSDSDEEAIADDGVERVSFRKAVRKRLSDRTKVLYPSHFCPLYLLCPVQIGYGYVANTAAWGTTRVLFEVWEHVPRALLEVWRHQERVHEAQKQAGYFGLEFGSEYVAFYGLVWKIAQTKEILSKQAVQTKEKLSKQAVKIAKQAEEHERFFNKVPCNDFP